MTKEREAEIRKHRDKCFGLHLEIINDLLAEIDSLRLDNDLLIKFGPFYFKPRNQSDIELTLLAECDQLRKENTEQAYRLDHSTQVMNIESMWRNIERLTAQLAKAREVLNFYAKGGGQIASQALKDTD